MSLAWQPTASLENLRARAQILRLIREFFHHKAVLEVETPVLAHMSVTDPYILSIPATLRQQTFYLQTSPEYAMKRLLAAGFGSIYQLCKAFRLDEAGKYHNPEFTMLEWYRVGFDHHQLMDEVDELLQLTLKTPPAERLSYADLFNQFLQINPHEITCDELIAFAKQRGVVVVGNVADKDTWLQLLLSHCIEPIMRLDKPYFIYDFPASQAALAKIQPTTPPVAARFEVYYKGIELANGFHELQHAGEQRRRFETNLQTREALDLPVMAIDEFFLNALEAGLPDCAGVALGLDRLVMLATDANSIAEVLSFDITRA